MGDMHVFLYSTADAVWAVGLALMAVAAVAIIAWAYGRQYGVREERAAATAQDEKHLADVLDEFGPLQVAFVSRDGARAVLRRVK